LNEGRKSKEEDEYEYFHEKEDEEGTGCHFELLDEVSSHVFKQTGDE